MFFRSITEMRKQLELLREKGAELPQETAELLEHQLAAEESTTEQNGAQLFDTMEISQSSEVPFEESVEVYFENI